MFRLVLGVFDCYIERIRFVLLALLFNFVMYCIFSTIVVAFEIYISIEHIAPRGTVVVTVVIG